MNGWMEIAGSREPSFRIHRTRRGSPVQALLGERSEEYSLLTRESGAGDLFVQSSLVQRDRHIRRSQTPEHSSALESYRQTSPPCHSDPERLLPSELRVRIQ